MITSFKVITKSKQETIDLGSIVSLFLKKGDVILLTGDLGAGKTTFTQGLAKGLGINDNVISPTFNILKCYFNKNLNLYHIDAYRLEGNNADIGLEEFIDGDGVCVIEWPQYISNLLPSNALKLTINNNGDDLRSFTFETDSDHYKKIIEEVIKNVKSIA